MIDDVIWGRLDWLFSMVRCLGYRSVTGNTLWALSFRNFSGSNRALVSFGRIFTPLGAMLAL